MASRKFGLVRVDGVENTMRALEAVERRVLNKGASVALNEAGELVRADAERRAPRGETSLLAEGMRKEYNGRSKRIRVGPHHSAYYGWFQEFGTSRMPAQPFMRPALDSNRVAVFKTIAARLKEFIE